MLPEGRFGLSGHADQEAGAAHLIAEEIRQAGSRAETQKMSACVRCGGKLREKKVEMHRRWGDKWYIVRNVPARVCDECQEEYYSASTLKRIDDMREEIMNSPERTEIPTVDFPKTKKAA